MALSKLWIIAYRDLGRNRRRSILSMIAVALGLGILVLMNGYIADRGNYIGVPAPTHAKLTEIVKKVERQEVKAAPALLGG